MFNYKKIYSRGIGVVLLCLSAIAVASCGAEQSKLQLIDQAQFQEIVNGKEVSLYTLTNSHGMTMQLTNFGARVVSLWTPDKNGEWADVTLGYDSIGRYTTNNNIRLLGAAVGRCANRIANGRFSIDGKEYQLSTNSGENSLHGGDKGFDQVVWSVDSLSNNAIVLSYVSKDGEEGYPGTLSVTLKYTITEANEFRIEYGATADKATHVNLSHHSFFNLKGQCNGTITDHILKVAANEYTPVNSDLIPTGEIASVDNTPFDFREPTLISSHIDDTSNKQIEYCKGYDQNFVLNRKSEGDLEFAASLYEPQSGRYLEVWTTEPAIQIFTGNFFDGTTRGKTEKNIEYRSGIALETQHYPNSPNQALFPSTLLSPGQRYSHTCVYRFGAK